MSDPIAKWVIGSGGFVGYILVSQPTPWTSEVVRADLEVTALYVHPLRRGCGWASELMAKACAYSASQGAVMALRVAPEGYGNATRALPYDRLKRFYNQFGFRTVRVRNPAKLSYVMPANCIMVRK